MVVDGATPAHFSRMKGRRLGFVFFFCRGGYVRTKTGGDDPKNADLAPESLSELRKLEPLPAFPDLPHRSIHHLRTQVFVERELEANIDLYMTHRHQFANLIQFS